MGVCVSVPVLFVQLYTCLGESNVTFYATPSPFLLNEICLNHHVGSPLCNVNHATWFQAWEYGIPLCKELVQLYEKKIKYHKLSDILVSICHMIWSDSSHDLSNQPVVLQQLKDNQA